MRAQDFSEIEDWPGYFGAVLGKEPRETLVRALDLFTDEGFAGGLAVDIAAGEGRDTLELLKRGWNVVATDGNREAFSYLWPRVLEAWKPRLTVCRGELCGDANSPLRSGERELCVAVLRAEAFSGALGQDRRGDSSRRPVRWAVFWETRLLGVDSESDAPLQRGDVEAAGGFLCRDDAGRRTG